MHLRRVVPALATLAALAGAPGSARASFPAGVWALVEQVELAPDADAPTQIRVDGVFMVAHTAPDFADYPGYSVPQRGHMFYACDEKSLAVCVMEWKELAAVAGSEDDCRGWGDSSLPDNGSVRPANDPGAKPDLYPISMGILLGMTPCDALRAWSLANPGGGSGTDTGTGTDPGTGTTDTPPETSDASSSEGGDESSDPSVGCGLLPGGRCEPSTGEPDPTTGGTGNLAGTDTADPQTGTGSTGASDGGSSDGGKAGCACDGGAADPGLAALALLGLGLARRRRR